MTTATSQGPPLSMITGLREQIIVNVRYALLPQPLSLEIITKRQFRSNNSTGLVYAWVYSSLSGTPQPIIKGPPAENGVQALEKLLEATEEMVGKACVKEYEAWEGKESVMVGDGFVLREVLPKKGILDGD